MAKSKGVGDTIEKIIKVTGLDSFVNGKDCGCEERKEKLNSLFPYKQKDRCFTEEEFNAWKDFSAVKTIKLNSDQVTFICDLYASIFNKPVWYPCTSCSPKPLISMIDRLDLIYKTYEKVN